MFCRRGESNITLTASVGDTSYLPSVRLDFMDADLSAIIAAVGGISRPGSTQMPYWIQADTNGSISNVLGGNA